MTVDTDPPVKNEKRDDNSMASWLSNIAVSLVFCVVFFLLLSFYILDLKKSVNVAEVRYEALDQHMKSVANDITELRHQIVTLQQVQSNVTTQISGMAQQPAAPLSNVPGVSATTVGNVTVVRGQLPANASINNQPIIDPETNDTPPGNMDRPIGTPPSSSIPIYPPASPSAPSPVLSSAPKH